MENETKKLLENQLGAFLENQAQELSKLKGFNMRSIYRVLILILSSAPLAIPLWMSATSAERKEAVVNVLNSYVDIPFVPESIEGMAIGFAYDFIAGRLG